MPNGSFSGIVDKIFQDNLSRFFDDNFWGFNGLQQSSKVPANIRETDKSFEMELVAPGLRKEDFRLNVNGNVLTVGYEHKSEDEQQNEGWLRKEFRKQSFSQSFTLSDAVDTGNISARYADGILYLTLPKKEEAQKLTRTIEIQ